MSFRNTFFCLTACFGLTACGDTAPIQNTLTPAQSEFIRDYYESRGITNETHGPFENIAHFTPSDTPQTLPKRENAFSGSGLELLVGHSQGHSLVQALYPLNVHKAYSKGGRGVAVPIQVRINPPANPGALYPRDRVKRLKLDKDYTFEGRLYAEANRDAAIQLSREVLSKTHCRGGTITENTDRGDFARAYAPRNRAANGRDVRPGWVLSYRCSRWRQR